MKEINRRDFMKLAGLGGVVLASGLGSKALGSNPFAGDRTTSDDDFYFVQLSDTHWGFDGPAVNPDSKGTLKKAIAAVNSLELTSEDSKHGFNLPDFKVRADVKPGSVTRVTFTPDKTGTFTFACDVFCGSGHEDMSGTLVVVD